MGLTDSPAAGRINLSDLVGWTDKQQQAYDAAWQYRFLLYGGARGGGKSRFLRWIMLLLTWYWGKKITGLHTGLFCETYPDLENRQISKIKLEFPPWAGELKSTQTDGLGFYLSDELGGGVIALRNLDDPSKYQSAEFGFIGIDELTKVDFRTFEILRGSLRWPGISRPGFIAATNPGGIGHLWVKQLWIDKQFPSNLAPLKHEFHFVQSLPSDNPYLDDQYWTDLNTLSDDLREAWVYGNWDVFAGMAFPSWSRERHVIQPFVLPDWWPRWRAIDWGSSKPFCCLWFAMDPDSNRIYVYREVYQTDLTDVRQAKIIKESTPPNETIYATYADPSMWARKNMDDRVTTTADQYREQGVMLTRADNDRLSGKRKVDRLLGSLPDGSPGIVIFSTCQNLIRTLPALPYDTINVEDVDTKAEDHAYDALRYGLTNTKIKLLPQAVDKTLRSPLEGLQML